MASGDCKRFLDNTCKHGQHEQIAKLEKLQKRVKKAKRAKRDPKEKPGKRKRPVILITGNGMGQAPVELGHKLVQTYLGLLDLDDRRPAAICLYGEGVKLAVEGSPVLDELRALAGKNIPVIVCTTCLNHFGLMDSLQAGTAGSMKDIIELQMAARKVITL